MSDAEQPAVMLVGLNQLARWSSLIGVFVVVAYIGAYFLIQQWHLLALAGVGAGIIVLWSFVPRISESSFEQGVWSYSAGLYLAALALGLMVRGPAVAVLLALPVSVVGLVLGRRALPLALGIALAVLGVVAGADFLFPWAQTYYGGYLAVVQLVADLGLLIGLGALVGHASARLHLTTSQTVLLREEAEGLSQRIERLSAERERELRCVLDITQLTITAGDESQLLEPAANMLRERFGLDNVMVYMPGPDGDYADLRMVVGRSLVVRTGTMGTVQVGAETPVGQALERLEVVTREKPEGSEAYAALAAPMVASDVMIGVLDLQSSKRDCFSEEEIRALTALADQLALAIAHVRQHAEPAAAAAAMARRSHLAAPPKSFQVGDDALVETMESLEPSTKEPVTQDDVLIAPISVQGELVGALGFREGVQRQLSTDELALVQAVAEQVAQAVENLNLLEGTERAALREQLVNDITAQLQRSTSVDEVLQITAQALQKALAGYEVSIRLSPEALGIGRPLVALSPLGDIEGEEER